MTKKEKELFSKGLPKWPKMYVTGIPITKEQALEIIRRTDDFFDGCSGNNLDLNKKVREILSVPSLYEEKSYESFAKKESVWKRKWKFIDLRYISNQWISSSFFFGANGWCHPDGIIGFSTNIGKYPDVKDVYNDWKKIAKEFPFLELGITLYNGECCEENIEPVVSFKIKDSIVKIIDPKTEDVHKDHPFETCEDYLDKINLKPYKGINYTNENAIPLEIIEEWKNYL